MTELKGTRPVARLAPSPTGGLHLGHARSFLLAWWHARSRDGSVVLRIEDLDHTRNKPGMVDACLRVLEWLGLDWDGAPLIQSADTTPYETAVERLLAQQDAYPCTCSRKAIMAALSAPHEGGEVPYPGTCHGRWPSVEAAERETGDAAGVRFIVPRGEVTFDDGFLGPQAHDVASAVGDFLIARRDGAFAYQLAVVVDDARQGITEVLRGDDLLTSTPRQKLLQRALGLPYPTWLHVPLVQDATGERLAKRTGKLGLIELMEAGVDPRRIVGWAAASAGQPAAPVLTPQELLASFDLTRMSSAPVRIEADRSWSG